MKSKFVHEVRIRPAIKDDLVVISRLFRRLMDYQSSLDPRSELSPDFNGVLLFEKLLQSANVLVLVAETDKQVIGCMTARILKAPKIAEAKPKWKLLARIFRQKPRLYPTFKIDRWGYLGDLFVDPTCRTQGVAHQLMSCSIEWLRGRNIHFVEAEVDIENSISLKLCDGQGFEKCKLIMRRKI